MSANDLETVNNTRNKLKHDTKKVLLTRRRIIGLLAGPALLVVVLFAPLPLNGEQKSLLAIVVMTVVYWIAQPISIPVTSILALTLAVVLNVASARTVFGAFSSPTLFLLLGGFIITLSMAKYGLGKRIALAVLSLPGVGGSTRNIVIAFGLMAALLSGVIDNGAIASMLVPVAIGIVHALSDDIYKQTNTARHPLRFATALMLITAYGATLGALLTPFGDSANMVGRQFIREEFGVAISIGKWMMLSAPIVIVLFFLLVIAVLVVNPPEVRYVHAAAYFRDLRRQLGVMSRGEKNTAVVFGMAVFFWLLPAFVTLVSGPLSSSHIILVERLPPSVVAMLAACCLFVLPVGRHEGFTMRWRDVRQMDWGPILLVGSALALGKLMSETGLAQTVGAMLAEKIGDVGQLGVSFFSSATAILFSEVSNNLVSITVLVPTIVPVAEAGGGDPLVVALVATFSAIYGFMLPISTSANVIVYGSGLIPVRQMIKTGFIVDLSGILVITLGVSLMLNFINLTPF